MNKEDNFKEKFKQALISTVKVISEDYNIQNNNKKLNEENLKINDLEKNIIAEYYQRCFGEDLPESSINIKI